MSFRIALSGLDAATIGLKVAANNIANAGTPGFKASRTESAEVVAAGTQAADSNATGSGVRISNISEQPEKGKMDLTEQLINMIELSRQYEAQIDSIRTAKEIGVEPNKS